MERQHVDLATVRATVRAFGEGHGVPEAPRLHARPGPHGQQDAQDAVRVPGGAESGVQAGMVQRPRLVGGHGLPDVPSKIIWQDRTVRISYLLNERPLGMMPTVSKDAGGRGDRSD